jgi:hypothetical protein
MTRSPKGPGCRSGRARIVLPRPTAVYHFNAPLLLPCTSHVVLSRPHIPLRRGLHRPRLLEHPQADPNPAAAPRAATSPLVGGPRAARDPQAPPPAAAGVPVMYPHMPLPLRPSESILR